MKVAWTLSLPHYLSSSSKWLRRFFFRFSIILTYFVCPSSFRSFGRKDGNGDQLGAIPGVEARHVVVAQVRDLGLPEEHLALGAGDQAAAIRLRSIGDLEVNGVLLAVAVFAARDGA